MASGFSSSARTPPADPLERQLTCSICIDIFVEPVTTSCGHSFCRGCLDRSLRLNSSTCPLCNGHLQRTPGVNIVLRSVIEEIKKEREEEEVRRREREEEEEMRRREREEEEVRRLREEEELRKVREEEEVRRRVAEEKELWRREREEEEKRRKEEEERREWEKQQEEERRKREEEECDPRRFRGRPGQVACNICTKMAATKSCLICLVSYCDEHLQIHSANGRLKGHKLVDPVEDLDQRACLVHGRPLELYSRKQNKCICVLCMEKGEEGVVSTEDEWTNKKAKLKDTTEDLKESIMKRKTKMEEINASLKSCKDQLDTEWWDIDAVFSAALATLEAAQAKALRPVEERRQRLTQEASCLCETLQTEVTTLEMTISELNHISTFEDHVLFLQKYPSIKEPGVKDWTAVELDTCVNFGSLRKITAAAMEQIQGHLDELTALELKRLKTFAVDVTLDPNSSHKRLVLSKDQKEVIDGDTEQEVSDDVERFDVFGSVLGTEGQDSGSRAYWEVQVGGKSGWDLGVASAKANRKGKLTLSPDEGYWAIVHYEGDKYAALTAPPVSVQLKHNPQKVGVFLDHDEGLLSFYSVMEKAHIYSFTEADFKGQVLPYFSPHVKNETNTGALIISTLNSS